jgi:hypothetical protein
LVLIEIQLCFPALVIEIQDGINPAGLLKTLEQETLFGLVGIISQYTHL